MGVVFLVGGVVGKLYIPPISCVLRAKALIQFLDRTTTAEVMSLPPLGASSWSAKSPVAV
jgi:hypothetical protein